MRYRRGFAALSALLLVIAAWGSTACDLACSLRILRPTCHTASVPTSAQGAMTHMHHAHFGHMRDGTVQATSPVDLMSASGCHHSACTLAGAESVPTKTFQFDQLNWMSLAGTAVSCGNTVSVDYSSENDPPGLSDRHRPLTLALRI